MVTEREMSQLKRKKAPGCTCSLAKSTTSGGGGGGGGLITFALVTAQLLCRIQSASSWSFASFTPGRGSASPCRGIPIVACRSLSLDSATPPRDGAFRRQGGAHSSSAVKVQMGIWLASNPLKSKWRSGESSNSGSGTIGNSGSGSSGSSSSTSSNKRWAAGMWDKLTAHPPSGRAHDEVTFRSGCEGRTLTIPQGKFCSPKKLLLLPRTNITIF